MTPVKFDDTFWFAVGVVDYNICAVCISLKHQLNSLIEKNNADVAHGR